MEFVFGGNPWDSGSFYRLEVRLEDMQFPVIEFHRSRTVARHYYDTYLEELTEEYTWEPLSTSAIRHTHIVGGGIEKIVLRPQFGRKGYYRIRVTPRF